MLIGNYGLESDEIESGEAFENAVAALTDAYGLRKTTAKEQLEELLSGDKIGWKDTHGFQTFLLHLQRIFLIAKHKGSEADFDRRNTIANVIGKKLPQFKAEWSKKQAKTRGRRQPELGFQDLLDFLNEQYRVCDERNRIENEADIPLNPKSSAKVAAVNEEEEEQTSYNSYGPKVPPPSQNKGGNSPTKIPAQNATGKRQESIESTPPLTSIRDGVHGAKRRITIWKPALVSEV